MNYTIIKSNRKTIAIQVTKNGEVVVRTPKFNVGKKAIDQFVTNNQTWITKQLANVAKRNNFYDLSDIEMADLKKLAKEVLPQKVAYYESTMGVKSTGVKITSATTRFGSCNGKNSICFSYRLMLFPENAIEYVVVHELAHILQKNHSKAFYKIVEHHMPDYKEREKCLKI